MTTTTTKWTLPELCAEHKLTVECGKAVAKEKDGWHGIEFDTRLLRDGREVWRGAYTLGIRHATPKHAQEIPAMSAYERGMFEGWKRTPLANFKEKLLQAFVSEKIANANGIRPKTEDVIYSLLLDGSAYFDAQSFEEWASDLGYDVYSRKAEAIWRECDATGRKLARAFTAKELSGLREAANKY